MVASLTVSSGRCRFGSAAIRIQLPNCQVRRRVYARSDYLLVPLELADLWIAWNLVQPGVYAHSDCLLRELTGWNLWNRVRHRVYSGPGCLLRERADYVNWLVP